MWRFLAPFRNREPQLAVRRSRKGLGKRPASCRPWLESLEDRTVLDVGDSLGSALLTGLGPAAGTYTMPSEFMGDGRFKTLDVDLYRFDAQAGQALKATTSAPSGTNNTADTILILFDANGTYLAENDNAYGTGNSPFSRIDYQFTASGGYYIGVSGAGNYYYNPNLAGSGTPAFSTGYYRLDLSLSTPVADAAGDTLATALDTGFGPNPSSTPSTYSVPSAQIGDGLYLTKDVDFYKFTANAGALLTASTALPSTGGQSMYTYLGLFDVHGSLLATGYPYYYSNTYASIQSYQFGSDGTYYLAVAGNPPYYYNPNVGGSAYYAGSVGDYRLDMSLYTPPPDAAGDTLATAQDTGLNQASGTFTATAKIGDGTYLNRDVDLYKVQVNAGQAVSVTTALPSGGQALSTYVRLFDASGHELTNSIPYTYGYGSIPGYEFNTAGTYYIGVSGYYNFYYDPNVPPSFNNYSYFQTGDYSININLFSPTPDPAGDTLATALATGLGSGATTSYTTNDYIGDGLYLNKDVDLYKFHAAAGQGLIANTTQPASGTTVTSILRLFDATGHPLLSDAFSNGRFNHFKYLFSADGDYYLGVSGYPNYNYDPNVGGSGSTYSYYYYPPTGNYSLSLNLVTPTFDSEGDTLATAVSTGLGAADGSYSHAAKIGDNWWEGKDVDIYSFQATAGQFLNASTSLPSGGSSMATIVRLFDANGNQLATAFPYNYPTYSSYASLQQYKFSASGTYYVGISGYYNPYYNPKVAGSGNNAYSTGDYALTLSLVTPTPDNVGDTIATALDTGINGQVQATATFGMTAKIGDGLYLSSDVDMYKFHGSAGQAISAATSLPAGGQSMTTYLRLFDSAGNQLATGYGSPYYGNSYASLSKSVLPADGDYYIGVSGYPNWYYNPNVGGSYINYYGQLPSTGDYHLDLSLTTPPPDVGDTLATAQVTTLGPAAGTYAVPNQHIGDGAYGARDVDMYRIQANAGQLLSITFGLPAGGQAMNGVVRLFDPDGNEVNFTYYYNSWYNGNGSVVVIQDLQLRKTGAYSIGISGAGNFFYNPTVAGSGWYAWSTGDYSLNLALVDPPPPDSVGDTLATALPTGLGTTSSTYTMPSTQIGDGTWRSLDVDMYQFTAPAGLKLTAITSAPAGSTNPMYTVLRLFDASGHELQLSGSFLPSTNGGGYSEIDYVFATAGTYYIGVSGNYNAYYDPTVAGSDPYPYGASTGDYRLDMTLSVPVPDNVGDTLSTALATGLGTNGKKSYNFGKATIGDGAYGARDVDLYQFQADAGQTFTAMASLPNGSSLTYGPELRLFDSSGNELANSYDYNQLEWQFDTPGIYYVGVSGPGNGGYDPNMAGSGQGAATGAYILDLNLIDPKVVQGHNVKPSVRGHGEIGQQNGQKPVGEQINSIDVNAWLDGNGNVHGRVIWNWSHNNGQGSPQQGSYPWYMQVTTLQISGNAAYIEATVVRSPKSPGDVGTHVGFWIYDNGSGHSATDFFVLPSASYYYWNFQPIKGNFTVRS
jgi:hypothetical protein